MLRLRALVLLCAAAFAVSAAPASADIGLSGCDNPAVSQPFAPWLDYTDYFLAPDGSFDNGASGWALNGASASNGVLSLGSGASATSPEVCVGLEHPTFRFFVRRTGGSPLASLSVKAVVGGVTIPLGAVGGVSSMQPSPVMLIGANLAPLLTGGTSTQVAFRFEPNAGTWQVDDVYVDPRGSH
jgi:hypothetical protein